MVYATIMLSVAALAGVLILLNSSVGNFRRRLIIQPAPALQRRLSVLQSLRWVLYGLSGLLVVLIAVFLLQQGREAGRQYEQVQRAIAASYDPAGMWAAPDPAWIDQGPDADLIQYGRDLIVHTTDYFGEFGLVRPNSINGLNCQNCHLDAGAKVFGNNYAAVAPTYPKVRARSGAMESIPYRVNDCFMRSLDGEPLDTNSREMRAIVAYIKWLGSNVPVQTTPKGSGLVEVPFLDRPADPARGKAVYDAKCASCHGADGQGLPMPESARHYPPLWGPKSYAESAGLFRLSRFAGYVKANMPFGATYQSPQLSDEEAWDVAAFVNSQPRPAHKYLDQDWPDISKKPYDHPFGPFADTFPEAQHKYGPYGPIVAFAKTAK